MYQLHFNFTLSLCPSPLVLCLYLSLSLSLSKINENIFKNFLKETLPFVTIKMNLENIMQSEISQTDRQILYDLTYISNLKKLSS